MDKGMKRKLIIIFLITALSVLMFITAQHIVTTSTGGNSYSVIEDVSSFYNITVNNSDFGQDANITQVNITLPVSFIFTPGSNGTDSSSNFSFSTIDNILSWSNSSGYTLNGSESKNFWFNATAPNPGNYNLTITTLNTTGAYINYISVKVNDTTSPLISFSAPTLLSGVNLSQKFIPVNVTASDNGLIDTVKINLYNSTYLLIITNSSVNSNYTVLFVNFTGLSDGAYYINATVNDSFGNSNSTETRTITLDTTVPTIDYGDLTITAGNYSQNWIVANVTASDTYLKLINITLYNSTDLINSTSTTTSPNYINFTNLSDGIYYLNATAEDYAGNTNQTATYIITLDTTLPVPIFGTGTENTGVNKSQTWIYTNVSVTETNEANITFSLSNSTGVVNSTTYTDKTRTINWTNLADGAYTYDVMVVDYAGNSNSTETRTITLDTTVPNVFQFNSPLNNSNLSKIQTINVTANDTILSVDSVYFNITNNSGQILWLKAEGRGDYWNATLNTSFLGDGEYDIIAYANDTVGNLNANVRISVKIDNTYPYLISSKITGAYYNGSDYFFSPANQDGMYDNMTMIMNASELIMDWGRTYIYNLTDWVKYFDGPSGYVAFNTETWNGTRPASKGGGYAPDGRYRIETAMTDYAGNTNTTFVNWIYIDNTGPNFYSLNRTPSPSYNNDSVRINVTINDSFLEVTSVWVAGNWEGVLKNYTPVKTGQVYSYLITSGNFSNQENVSYQWFANDSVGNIANSLIRSFIVENRAPVFINSPIGNLTFQENGIAQQINLSNYFYDMDNDSLTYGPSSLQNFSIYTINNGVLTLAPSYGYSGVTRVAFFANDSYSLTYSNIVTLNITSTNHPPRSNLIPNITFNEDMSNNTLNLSNYFFDDDGVIINYNYTDGNNIQNLTISINNSIVNVSANANWFGNASVYFTAKDNAESIGISNKVLIFVTPINDIPIINIPNQTIEEDSGEHVLNLSNYTSDVESNPAGFTYFVYPENSSRVDCFISQRNLIYEPAVNWFGLTSCDIIANDGINNSTAFRLWINVTNKNDAPTIISSAATNAIQDIPYTYQLNVIDADNEIIAGMDTLIYSLIVFPDWIGVNPTTGLIAGTPKNKDVGTNNMLVLVSDGRGGNATQSFAISVANVNDAPVLSLIGMQNLKVNQTYYYHVNATDIDAGDTLSFYDNTSLFDISSVGIINFTPSFAQAGKHYVNISVKDLSNTLDSEIVLFNVTFANNAPVANNLNITTDEDTNISISLNCTDADGDSVAYSIVSDVSNGSLSGSGNTKKYSPKKNYNGNDFFTYKCADNLNMSNIAIVNITISSVNDAPIIESYSPSQSKTLIKEGKTQTFSITKSDVEGTTLSVKWKLNGSEIVGETADSYTYTATSIQKFNLTAEISDGENATIHTWEISVLDKPIATGFDGATTNFSKLSETELSSVSNVVLEKTNYGKVQFNENIDLSKMLDFENAVKVTNGVFAIDSSNHPEMNKKATITLKGLSYSSVPEIYYTDEFTTNIGQIDKRCDFCKTINYTNFPTSNGVVVFSVSHFTSFMIGGSGEVYDLDSFDDLEKCEEDIQGNLEIEIKNPKKNDEFFPGEIIKVKVKAKNENDGDKKIVVKSSLYNINEDDEEATAESKSVKVEEGKSETFNLEMKVPEDFNEDDAYIVFAKVYEKGEEESQCNYEIVDVDLEREKQNVVIKEIVLDNLGYPGRNFEVIVETQNTGSDDQEVYIEISNSALEIHEKSDAFTLESYGEDDSFTTRISFPLILNITKGEYPLQVKAVFDDEDVSETKNIVVAEKTPEEKDVISLGTGKVTDEGFYKGKISYTLINLVLITSIVLVAILIILNVSLRKKKPASF